MKTLRIVSTIIVSFALILSLSSLVQAQGEEPPIGEGGEGGEVGTEIFDEPAFIIDPIVVDEPYVRFLEPMGPDLPAEPDAPEGLLSNILPFQGRLLNSAGVGITGSRSITLSLYEVSSGGTAVCTDTDTTAVTSGLFYFSMDFCDLTDITGQQLYLGVKVGLDTEMTDRQAIYAVPYARSLKPGAIIEQTVTNYHALELISNGDAFAGTTLTAYNTGAAGIGAWITASGTDTALVVENKGAGPIFKGFGDNGDGDEFQIGGDGQILTRADTYYYISGASFIKNESADTTRWNIQAGGEALIYSGNAAGDQQIIYYPVDLPSELFGTDIYIENVIIYYHTSNAANAYITGTDMDKLTGTYGETQTSMITDSTDRTSTTATNYILAPDAAVATLGDMHGAAIFLTLQFANNSSSVTISGIRLRLRHHTY